jgi:hypothetical protein
MTFESLFNDREVLTPLGGVGDHLSQGLAVPGSEPAAAAHIRLSHASHPWRLDAGELVRICETMAIPSPSWSSD